jgi:AraC-like DNA-binding protein
MRFTQYEIQVLIEIHDLIQNNFKNHVFIKDILCKYHIPESTLSQAFKQLFHKSISQYRLELCMHYAKTLIEQGWQVKAVTLMMGYTTTGSFSRAFRKIYFCSPGKWAQL